MKVGIYDVSKSRLRPHELSCMEKLAGKVDADHAFGDIPSY